MKLDRTIGIKDREGLIEADYGKIAIYIMIGTRTFDMPGNDSSVARSRQVCIKWWWKHCLMLSIYLRDEQILIHIRKPFSGERPSRANSWPLSS
jgi:hypothetical protein